MACYIDDEDLDRMLREKEREGDPMAEFIKKKERHRERKRKENLGTVDQHLLSTDLILTEKLPFPSRVLFVQFNLIQQISLSAFKEATASQTCKSSSTKILTNRILVNYGLQLV